MMVPRIYAPGDTSLPIRRSPEQEGVCIRNKEARIEHERGLKVGSIIMPDTMGCQADSIRRVQANRPCLHRRDAP